MEGLWTVVAVIGAIFVLVGFITILVGIFVKPRTLEDASPLTLPEKIWEYLKKLAGILLGPGQPGKKMIALGLIMMIIGGGVLYGGIKGATDDVKKPDPPTTTTTTTISSEPTSTTSGG